MDPINKKRIITFLVCAFGISWAAGLVIYLTGGLTDSPIIIESSGITLAYVLLASAYMWGPCDCQYSNARHHQKKATVIFF